MGPSAPSSSADCGVLYARPGFAVLPMQATPVPTHVYGLPTLGYPIMTAQWLPGLIVSTVVERGLCGAVGRYLKNLGPSSPSLFITFLYRRPPHLHPLAPTTAALRQSKSDWVPPIHLVAARFDVHVRSLSLQLVRHSPIPLRTLRIHSRWHRAPFSPCCSPAISGSRRPRTSPAHAHYPTRSAARSLGAAA